jgi:hypothetical protein
MKRIVLLFGCIWLLSALLSCKKCVSCTITDSNGNEIATALRTCGNKQQIDDARAEAKIRGENLGGSASCSEVD